MDSVVKGHSLEPCAMINDETIDIGTHQARFPCPLLGTRLGRHATSQPGPKAVALLGGCTLCRTPAGCQRSRKIPSMRSWPDNYRLALASPLEADGARLMKGTTLVGARHLRDYRRPAVLAADPESSRSRTSGRSPFDKRGCRRPALSRSCDARPFARAMLAATT